MKHNKGRQGAEGNHVCQGVQFFANIRIRFQPSCHKSVKKIKNCSQPYQIGSIVQISFEDQNNANTATKQITNGQKIGEVFNQLQGRGA